MELFFYVKVKPSDLQCIFLIEALGDERRSFSYYKAIPVIEKLPFTIESVEQVKHLPAIGKSMKEHVGECSLANILSFEDGYPFGRSVAKYHIFHLNFFMRLE